MHQRLIPSFNAMETPPERREGCFEKSIGVRRGQTVEMGVQRIHGFCTFRILKRGEGRIAIDVALFVEVV